MCRTGGPESEVEFACLGSFVFSLNRLFFSSLISAREENKTRGLF